MKMRNLQILTSRVSLARGMYCVDNFVVAFHIHCTHGWNNRDNDHVHGYYSHRYHSFGSLRLAVASDERAIHLTFAHHIRPQRMLISTPYYRKLVVLSMFWLVLHALRPMNTVLASVRCFVLASNHQWCIQRRIITCTPFILIIICFSILVFGFCLFMFVRMHA